MLPLFWTFLTLAFQCPIMMTLSLISLSESNVPYVSSLKFFNLSSTAFSTGLYICILFEYIFISLVGIIILSDIGLNVVIILLPFFLSIFCCRVSSWFSYVELNGSNLDSVQFKHHGYTRLLCSLG